VEKARPSMEQNDPNDGQRAPTVERRKILLLRTHIALSWLLRVSECARSYGAPSQGPLRVLIGDLAIPERTR
jgi:hypothetical protein